jgi:hypothetical protein
MAAKEVAEKGICAMEESRRAKAPSFARPFRHD